MAENIRTYTKTDLIDFLETYGDIIVSPEDHTWEELAEKLRYYKCGNCISYESREECERCTNQILYEYDDFYEV